MFKFQYIGVSENVSTTGRVIAKQKRGIPRTEYRQKPKIILFSNYYNYNGKTVLCDIKEILNR